MSQHVKELAALQKQLTSVKGSPHSRNTRCCVKRNTVSVRRPSLSTPGAASKAHRLVTLRKVHILDDLNATQLGKLADELNFVDYAAGDTIIEEGSAVQCLCIILEGEAAINIKGGTSKHFVETVAHLKTFDYCGEMSLLSGAKASASVVAHKQTVTAVILNKEQFFRFFPKPPAAMLARELKNYRLNCHKAPIFSQLSKAQRETLIGATQVMKAEKGEYLLHQGQMHDFFGVLVAGHAKVVVDVGEEGGAVSRKFIRELGSTDYFGQRSTWNEEARFSVVVTETAVALIVPREQFKVIHPLIQRLQKDEVSSKRKQSQQDATDMALEVARTSPSKAATDDSQRVPLESPSSEAIDSTQERFHKKLSKFKKVSRRPSTDLKRVNTGSLLGTGKKAALEKSLYWKLRERLRLKPQMGAGFPSILKRLELTGTQQHTELQRIANVVRTALRRDQSVTARDSEETLLLKALLYKTKFKSTHCKVVNGSPHR
jgi:CRP-like cAMP-binding protein